MAGYVTDFQGRVYEGLYTAAVAMPNGIWVEIVTDATVPNGKKVQPLSAAYDPTKETYFLENEWDVDYTSANPDVVNYMCKPKQFVRMHRMLSGEEVIMSLEKALYDSLNVGDLVAPAAGGAVVAGGETNPLRVHEKLTLWGLPAVRLIATANV